jgi:hypothetical protein
VIHGLADFREVGHVERESTGEFGAALLEVLYLLYVAGGNDHPFATGEHGLGQFPAETGRAAGDEPDVGFGSGVCHGSSSSFSRLTCTVWLETFSIVRFKSRPFLPR